MSMHKLNRTYLNLGAVAIAALAFLSASGCSGSSAVSPATPVSASNASNADAWSVKPDTAITPMPGSAAFIGAWVNTSGTPHPSASVQELDTEQLESKTKSTLDLHMHYYNWAQMLDGAEIQSELQADFSHNRIPVISWNCSENGYTLPAFSSSGPAQLQSDLKAIAHNFGALNYRGVKKRVFVRWFWEFNLNVGNPKQNPNSNNCYDTLTGHASYDTQFTTAWKYVRSTVAPVAPNVTWLWNPDGGPSQNMSELANFYPDGSVDWIGVDAYDQSNLGFMGVFDPFFRAFGSKTESGSPVPIMIAETGEQAGNSASFTQYTYLQTALSAMQNHTAPYSQLDALMYFDAKGQPGTPFDWRLNSGGLTAFAQLLQKL